MKNEELINTLKNLSVYDVLNSLLSYKDVEKESVENTEPKKEYLTSKDLINMYPAFFSTYKLSKYIKNDDLPYIQDGKQKIFLKSQVEAWLEKKNTEAMFRSL